MAARWHLDDRDLIASIERFGWPHPASSGCLLALVREAWNDETIYVCPDAEGRTWWAMRPKDGDLRREDGEKCAGLSEAEALVEALDAAPPRTKVS